MHDPSSAAAPRTPARLISHAVFRSPHVLGSFQAPQLKGEKKASQLLFSHRTALGSCKKQRPPDHSVRLFPVAGGTKEVRSKRNNRCDMISSPGSSGRRGQPVRKKTRGLWSLVDRRRVRRGCKSPPPMDNPPEPAAFPRCVACGETMRLITIEPAYFYRHLDEHVYSCRCGASLAAFVSRDDAGD